ncbi:MAG TPA: MutL protein [Thermoanaerobacterales bacterium]|nr:MutL protein [Thermoanaerobacterales bacterium]
MLLLTDFGSTYTKLVAVNIKELKIIGSANSMTTVDTDIMIGFNIALTKLKNKIGYNIKFKERIASSSAAGGLRVVAIGLVPKLTAEAAQLAALKAGAKIVGVFTYRLSEHQLEMISNLAPDIILLSGGIDGGNEEWILHNAKILAKLQEDIPIVLAGNKYTTPKAKEILISKNKDVYITENVLPDLNKINVEPAREAIRKIFIEKIIYGKGIDKAQKYMDKKIMPTPVAVLKGAELLADGIDKEKGIGELMVVDVGGATTDIYSVNKGISPDRGIIYKGLPQPYAKRTVEGDLGVRYNAPNLIKMVEDKELKKINSSLNIKDWIKHINRAVNILPDTKEKIVLDEIMARKAVEVAVERHAGVLETINIPGSTKVFQRGKDLRNIKYVIGTGGPITYSKNPYEILKGCLLIENDKNLLKPIRPNLLVDREYIFSAMGLMAYKYPLEALKIMKKHLK